MPFSLLPRENISTRRVFGYSILENDNFQDSMVMPSSLWMWLEHTGRYFPNMLTLYSSRVYQHSASLDRFYHIRPLTQHSPSGHCYSSLASLSFCIPSLPYQTRTISSCFPCPLDQSLHYRINNSNNFWTSFHLSALSQHVKRFPRARTTKREKGFRLGPSLQKALESRRNTLAT